MASSLLSLAFPQEQPIPFIYRIIPEDILKEQSTFMKFDRYRKLRNGINYYGEDIDIETVKEAIIEIPKLIKELEKFSKD